MALPGMIPEGMQARVFGRNSWLTQWPRMLHFLLNDHPVALLTLPVFRKAG